MMSFMAIRVVLKMNLQMNIRKGVHLWHDAEENMQAVLRPCMLRHKHPSLSANSDRVVHPTARRASAPPVAENETSPKNAPQVARKCLVRL